MFQLIAFACLLKFLSKHFHINSDAFTWNFSAKAVQANRVASCPRNYRIVFVWGGYCIVDTLWLFLECLSVLTECGRCMEVYTCFLFEVDIMVGDFCGQNHPENLIAGGRFERPTRGHEPRMFPLHYPACCIRSLQTIRSKGIKSRFYTLKIPNTNYTFPYSYLVTTSFQLRTYWRRPTRDESKRISLLSALKADPLSDRDGRFVQNSRTCSPQLGWFAITGDSIFTHFKLQKAIRTEKTFISRLQRP